MNGLTKGVMVVAIIGILLRVIYNYWVFLPAIYHMISEPIQPNQVVRWNPVPKQAETSDKPNIVLIVADDMGFNDLSIYGGFRDLIKTPNIDSIGLDGVVFKNAYAGHATCAPCRAALLTGRHASKIGYEYTPADATASWILGSLMGNGKLKGVYHSSHASSLNVSAMVLPRSEILLPEVLQSNGYHTVQVGKWHLGSQPGYHPINRGFKESLGFDIIASYLPFGHKEAVGCHFTDFFDRYLWANSRYEVKKDDGPSFEPKGYLTDYLSNQASDVITHLSAANQPYFVYLAYTSMHTPLTAFKSDYETVINLERQRVKEYAKNGSPYPPKPLSECERVYGAMLLAMDRGVGEVLKAIDKSPQRDNTVVMFTNDNGAPLILHDLNKPYRGSKATFFEGGIRVPMMMRYPNQIEKGIVSEDIVSHIDIFDTLVSAAGITKSKNDDRDGVNLLPYLTKLPHADLPPPHEILFWRSGHYMALRNENYKLQVQVHPRTHLPRYWLYDLNNDPYEKKNLMKYLEPDESTDEVTRKRYQSIFDDLLQIIQRENAVHPVPLWPSLSETPILIDKIFYDNYEEGDEYIYWPN